VPDHGDGVAASDAALRLAATQAADQR